MKKDTFYKVLWVDDDLSIIQGYQLVAETKDIELDVATNWEEAEEKLRINFNEYSAIILDAQCKIKKTDLVASKLFLGHVSVRLSRIYGEKHKFIPWYVLSAGTMDDFGVVLELINTEERQNFDSLWGRLKYIKAAEEEIDGVKVPQEEILFENIKRVASSTGINTVLFRHYEVFKYLGENRVFGYVKARTYMLKMLSALYYPEENLNFVYEGNPLRKVIEYIFRGASKYGLLPDDCFDSRGHIVLLDASRFMAGLDTNAYEGRILKHKIRFGNRGTGKDGAGGDRIFNEEVAMFVKNILNFSSSDSHTSEEDPYVIEEEKKEIFFGYVLQLCHVIKWMGEYINNNSDVEINKSKSKILPLGTSKTSTTNKSEEQLGKKSVPEKTIEIPPIESLMGTESYIMYNKNGKLACGSYCKLDSKYSPNLGKKAIIKNLVMNKDKDSKYLPYVATDIEIVE